jgi:endonuclease G
MANLDATTVCDPQLESEIAAVVAAAAARWDRRTEVRQGRTQALEAGNYLAADSPERLAMRVNTLVDDVRSASRDRRPPKSDVLRKLVEAPSPVTAAELDNEMLEAVLRGASEFLSVEFLERGAAAARSVGRVIISTGGGDIARGTGFLVAPGVMLTNHHVLPNLAMAEAGSIQMDFEANRFGSPRQPTAFRLEPERLYLADKALDYALVAVGEPVERGAALDSYGWLPLNRKLGKIAVAINDYLNIVQHPLGREKEIVLRENRILDLKTGREADSAEIGAFIHYEGDTEKGSSGSPVFNDQWDVIALHHSGVPSRNDAGQWLDRNGKVWNRDTQSLADVEWIANEGVRVSALVAALAAANLSGDADALVKRVIAAQPPATPREAQAAEALAAEAPAGIRTRLATPTRSTPRPTVAPAASASGNELSFEIPLRISIGLGTAAPVMVTAATTRPAAVVDDTDDDSALERLGPQDLADRGGYDPRFLGVTVPLPKLKPKPRFGGLLRIARPSRPADTTELRYRRYSILMSAGRRLAYVSACNIDYSAPATASRDEGTGSWRLDPRLGAGDQLGPKYYDGNDYDKGHLTRRDDVGWGRTKAEAIQSNNDSFFYPNAAPQFFNFNRSDEFTGLGLDLWGDLENFIQQQGEAQRTRLSVFSGPVFGTNDKRLKDALVPLQYWKIVLWRDGTSPPGALGFVLDQADLIRNLAEEAIDPGRFVIRQRRIAAIEALLDLDLGPVNGFDRMPPPGPNESLEDDILIGGLSDIQFSAT